MSSCGSSDEASRHTRETEFTLPPHCSSVADRGVAPALAHFWGRLTGPGPLARLGLLLPRRRDGQRENALVLWLVPEFRCAFPRLSAPVNCKNKDQLFCFVGQQRFGSVIAQMRYPTSEQILSHCGKGQPESVRSVVLTPSHLNGLRICRRTVFATCDLAKFAVTNLRIRSTCPRGG